MTVSDLNLRHLIFIIRKQTSLQAAYFVVTQQRKKKKRKTVKLGLISRLIDFCLNHTGLMCGANEVPQDSGGRPSKGQLRFQSTSSQLVAQAERKDESNTNTVWEWGCKLRVSAGRCCWDVSGSLKQPDS